MNEEYVCEICGKKFSSKKALYGHMRVHKEIKKKLEEIKPKEEVKPKRRPKPKKKKDLSTLSQHVLEIAEKKKEAMSKEWITHLKTFRETILKLKEMGFGKYIDLPIDEDGNVVLRIASREYIINEDGSLIVRKRIWSGIAYSEETREVKPSVKDYSTAYKLAQRKLKIIKNKLELL